MICLASGDKQGADDGLLESTRLLGEGFTATLLLFGITAVSSCPNLVRLPGRGDLTQQQRAALPMALARVIAIANDLGISGRFKFPIAYFDETEVQFSRVCGALDIEQLRLLGEAGIEAEHLRLAWAASAAGLNRGGPTEAYFLLLRARALPEAFMERCDVVTAAAAELGRFHRDMDVVSQAVDAGRDPFDDSPLSLTAEQAREVLRKEKESPAFPSRSNPGPDYADLFPADLCMCPSCRRERGQSPDPGDGDFDEDEMKKFFYEAAPRDVPRDILPALFEVAKMAYLTGEDPVEVMSEILGSPGGKRKKGRRR
jgi:hypothetical protein